MLFLSIQCYLQYSRRSFKNRLNDFIQNREERLRRYYIRSATKKTNEPTDIDSSSGYVSGETADEQKKSIQVIDRFGIILMIFANRAKSNISRLQIELAWLDYARLNITRGSGPTFGKFGKLFKEGLTINEEAEMEIVSYKGRGGHGAMQGEGETQLEIERRKIEDRKSFIVNQIKLENKNRNDHRLARQK